MVNFAQHQPVPEHICRQYVIWSAKTPTIHTAQSENGKAADVIISITIKVSNGLDDETLFCLKIKVRYE